MASILVLCALALATATAAAAEECTIGVAHGRAASGGRPLLWKVRDNPAVRDNEVYFHDSLPVPFVAVVTADGDPESPAWMGVNERGFAIVNANVEDFTRANGEFMREALGTCLSVADFIALLEQTNGGRDTHGNFGVIDSTGAAFIIEASADTFWTYDAEAAAPGYLIRTNFACVDTVGGITGKPGAQRFVRSTNLIAALAGEGGLSAADLVGRHARDFSDWASRPFAIPCTACGQPDSLPGWFDSYWSICSWNNVSAAVIEGVATGEAPWLSTMWVHLGIPACTIASPYWPVGPTPAVADGDTTAPLCDVAGLIRDQLFHFPLNRRLVDSYFLRDGQGGGLWATLLPAEDVALEATRQRLGRWRLDPPSPLAVQAFEDSLAVATYDLLVATALTPAPAHPGAIELACAPNPFNPATEIRFSLPDAGPARLEVYDLAGRRVARLVAGDLDAGPHRIRWRPRGLASGVYVARLTAAGTTSTRALLLLR